MSDSNNRPRDLRLELCGGGKPKGSKFRRRNSSPCGVHVRIPRSVCRVGTGGSLNDVSAGYVFFR